MSDKNSTAPEDLSALTTEQLESILGNEFTAETMDVDLIKRVTGELRARQPVDPDFDTEAGWREFERDYAGTGPLYDISDAADTNRASKARRHRRIRLPFGLAAAIAALVLLMSGTVTAYALGFDALGAMVAWTRDIFSIEDKSQSLDIPYEAVSGAAGISELESLLRENNIEESLIPSYIPEAYKQVEIDCGDLGGGNWAFTALYERENDSNALGISISNYCGGIFEKDLGEPEIYFAGGVQHFILTNMGRYSAVWTNGEFQCSISGLESKEELLKMVDSIYDGTGLSEYRQLGGEPLAFPCLIGALRTDALTRRGNRKRSTGYYCCRF